MPSSTLFAVESVEAVADHEYYIVVATNPASLVADLAPLVQQVYFNRADAEAAISAAAGDLQSFDGRAFLTDPEVEREILLREVDAAMPQDDDGRPKAFHVRRSEFCEIVAIEVLRGVFETRVPVMRVSWKEIPDQPTRGVDVLGLEGDSANLDLIIAEVKGSVDEASPPSVVEAMSSKLKELLGDTRLLHQELLWIRKRCGDAEFRNIAKLCIELSLNRLSARRTATPILVRPRSMVQQSDAGVFRANSAEYPDRVRWITVALEEDLNTLAEQVYTLIRQGGGFGDH